MVFFAQIAGALGGAEESGALVAGVLALLLLCFGVAADIGLALYWVKRPVSSGGLQQALEVRRVPEGLLRILLWLVFGLYLLGSVAAAVLAGGDEGERRPALAMLIQMPLFHLPWLAVAWMLLRRQGLSPKELWGLERSGICARLWIAAGLYLAALPPLWLVALVWNMVLESLGVQVYSQEVADVLRAALGWPLRAGLLAVTVLTAPLFEEIFFRGTLLPFLVNRFGLWRGIAVVSVLFGALHLHAPSFVPLVGLSVLLSLAYARTRSLWVPIGIHALFNAVSVLLIFQIR
jgi:membrane protease YdiL (CAAX protease family)